VFVVQLPQDFQLPLDILDLHPPAAEYLFPCNLYPATDDLMNICACTTTERYAFFERYVFVSREFNMLPLS